MFLMDQNSFQHLVKFLNVSDVCALDSTNSTMNNRIRSIPSLLIWSQKSSNGEFICSLSQLPYSRCVLIASNRCEHCFVHPINRKCNDLFLCIRCVNAFSYNFPRRRLHKSVFEERFDWAMCAYKESIHGCNEMCTRLELSMNAGLKKSIWINCVKAVEMHDSPVFDTKKMFETQVWTLYNYNRKPKAKREAIIRKFPVLLADKKNLFRPDVMVHLNMLDCNVDEDLQVEMDWTSVQNVIESKLKKQRLT